MAVAHQRPMRGVVRPALDRAAEARAVDVWISELSPEERLDTKRAFERLTPEERERLLDEVANATSPRPRVRRRAQRTALARGIADLVAHPRGADAPALCASGDPDVFELELGTVLRLRDTEDHRCGWEQAALALRAAELVEGLRKLFVEVRSRFGTAHDARAAVIDRPATEVVAAARDAVSAVRHVLDLAPERGPRRDTATGARLRLSISIGDVPIRSYFGTGPRRDVDLLDVGALDVLFDRRRGGATAAAEHVAGQILGRSGRAIRDLRKAADLARATTA